MTAIDDFIEKCEIKINKIKYWPIRDFTRGFLTGIDFPSSIIEGVSLGRMDELGPRKFLASGTSELYTIGIKNLRYFFDDLEFPFNTKKSAPRSAAIYTGLATGTFLTVFSYCIPSFVTGAINLTNFYLKKGEKKNETGK